MRGLQLLILFSLFFTTGCQMEKEASFQIDSSIKQIIFMSDESSFEDFQIEVPYYDAIIELRQEFPDEFKNMKTILPEEATVELGVKECPALLVLHNDEIIAKVVGQSTKEEIIEPITAALKN